MQNGIKIRPPIVELRWPEDENFQNSLKNKPSILPKFSETRKATKTKMGFPHMVFLPYKPAKFEGSSSMGRGCAPNGGEVHFRSQPRQLNPYDRKRSERENELDRHCYYDLELL